MAAGVVIAAVLLGFAAGLFSFKIKSRWCPTCGATTRVRRPPRNQNEGAYGG